MFTDFYCDKVSNMLYTMSGMDRQNTDIYNKMISGSKGSKLSCACTNEILTLGPAPK